MLITSLTRRNKNNENKKKNQFDSQQVKKDTKDVRLTMRIFLSLLPCLVMYKRVTEAIVGKIDFFNYVKKKELIFVRIVSNWINRRM